MPTRGQEGGETPGFTPVDGEGAEAVSRIRSRRARGVDGEGAAEEGSEDDARARRLAAARERLEKLKQVQQAQDDRRARLRQQQAAEEAPEAPEEEEELDLDALTYQISLEDLEEYLGIAIVPDDRARLQRRWQQKMRDPSIRHLFEDEASMAQGYALIPRMPRFFRGGQTVQTNLLNLLRNFPQLFDNVAQVISKYRVEPFFTRETPELDWAIVACEVLPDSLGRNYMEQKSVIKVYAQDYQANERRIQRRRLIEALYDIIVVNAITKDQIVRRTVDLTETKVGRQNFACINFGEKGIRINDVGRQQSHPLMGVCPSW